MRTVSALVSMWAFLPVPASSRTPCAPVDIGAVNARVVMIDLIIVFILMSINICLNGRNIFYFMMTF